MSRFYVGVVEGMSSSLQKMVTSQHTEPQGAIHELLVELSPEVILKGSLYYRGGQWQHVEYFFPRLRKLGRLEFIYLHHLNR